MLNFCEKVIQSKKIFKNFDLELEGEKNNKNISCGDIEAQNCVGIVSCLCIPVSVDMTLEAYWFLYKCVVLFILVLVFSLFI